MWSRYRVARRGYGNIRRQGSREYAKDSASDLQCKAAQNMCVHIIQQQAGRERDLNSLAHLTCLFFQNGFCHASRKPRSTTSNSSTSVISRLVFMVSIG